MAAFDPIERANLVVSAGAVATSALLASPLFAASVAAGAALEALNFRGLRRQSQHLFWGHIPDGRIWSGLYALRFGFLVVGIGAGFFLGLDPLGLVIGLSLIVPASLIEAWRSRPPLDPSAPALAGDDPAWDRWDPWLARERAEAEETDEDA